MSTVIGEKELRKAWLKRKFRSWEYHEELLKLHDEYLTALHRHWARDDIQKKFPDFYDTMQRPIFWNFDKVQKPGEISKESWQKKKTAGWANAISYNFSRGMDFGAPFTEYAGMPQDQIDHLNKLVGLILRYSKNIIYTVENQWDKDPSDNDWILDEKYTGPIDWPPNWREDIAHDLGVNLNSPAITRCEANQLCPQAGFWWTPAKENSRRYFQQNEIMPDYPNSTYGQTIWQWDASQS